MDSKEPHPQNVKFFLYGAVIGFVAGSVFMYRYITFYCDNYYTGI